ncbi:MAG: HAD-IA family hydrolase [Dysgonamonadaceae bacterium]|jgi:HAD superfamily hydrolase (TIGR01509 family)|nr:HAD-IA family hydrolase [Dysgonamonadaceae bacterium]
MIKAILFDMDGVLYDSMRSHVQAWQETMSAVGVESSLEDFYLFEGRTGHSTIDILFQRAFGKDATLEEKKNIYARKAQRFVELEQAESTPMPGSLEVLKKTKALGLQRIIVTGSGQHFLFEKLHKDFPGYFDKSKIVTAYDVNNGKPHPEPYLKGLEKGNLFPNEAIVIENAPLGIKAARTAGIFTVAVNTGPLLDAVLWDAGANVLFPSMPVLAENIEKLINQP